jgi:hypothetical protein
MSKRIVMVQPGKLGDILICAPIAKHYNDLGYEVLWPVFSNFISTISRFKYVTPIDFGIEFGGNYYSKKRAAFTIDSNNIEVIKHKNPESYSSIQIFDQINHLIISEKLETIDPCFAFPGHRNQKNIEKFSEYRKKQMCWIQLKYDLCNVPIEKRWNLAYTRDEKKEKELYDIIKKFINESKKQDYSVIHNYQGYKKNLIKPDNPIEFVKIKDFTIFDWLLVLKNSKEIYCIDSSLANYVEVTKELRENKKFYLGSEEKHYNQFMRNILNNNWTYV